MDTDAARQITTLQSRLFSVALGAALLLASQLYGADTAEKQSLTLDGAKMAIAAAVSEARGKNAPGAAIAVVDEGGNLIAVERLDNTFAAGAQISIGKARTAVMFKRPTKFFEEVINKGRTAMTTLNDFTPLQGGIPIVVDGQIIGAVGVSGAASAQQDEELAIAGANALAGSAALRASYHLYQGWGGFLGNLAMGVLFAALFLRWRRTWPFVIAHFLLDLGAGLGYIAFRDRLPGF